MQGTNGCCLPLFRHQLHVINLKFPLPHFEQDCWFRFERRNVGKHFTPLFKLVSVASVIAVCECRATKPAVNSSLVQYSLVLENPPREIMLPARVQTTRQINEQWMQTSFLPSRGAQSALSSGPHITICNSDSVLLSAQLGRCKCKFMKC